LTKKKHLLYCYSTPADVFASIKPLAVIVSAFLASEELNWYGRCLREEINWNWLWWGNGWLVINGI